MAFNPTLPVENTPLDAAQMRDQFNGLKALIDAQQQQLDSQEQEIDAQTTQINAQAAQLAEQQIQIAGLQAHFPLTAPEISSDLSSSADGSIAKSLVLAAPEAWQFVASVTSAIDPNQDLSDCTLLAVLAGSDDGGAAWTKHGGSGGIAPLMAARYRAGGQWSPFSTWVQAEM